MTHVYNVYKPKNFQSNLSTNFFEYEMMVIVSGLNLLTIFNRPFCLHSFSAEAIDEFGIAGLCIRNFQDNLCFLKEFFSSQLLWPFSIMLIWA